VPRKPKLKGKQKLKTHKATAKRFRLTGSGMVVRTKSSPQRLHVPAGDPTCVVAFGSDVPHLSPLGKALLVGPGSILDAHTDHERIAVSELQKSVEGYRQLAARLLEDDS
jgi:hypothetical protein